MKFTKYVLLRESKESEKDIEKTLSKIPENHRNLIKDYKISFQQSNSLHRDEKHIGVIDEKNKTITIAAPWNYGREFTLLHEIAHAVWKYLVSEQKKEEWSRLFKEAKSKNKKDLSQNEEEIFCMTYAQYYAKNKLKKFDHKNLLEFVSKI